MTNENFLFVSIPNKIEFEEAKSPYARIQITAMELDKISNNGNRYKFSERESIRESLIGKPVYFGLDVKREGTGLKQKHKTDEQAGIIEKAWIIGGKIKAVVKVTLPKVLSMIKQGFRNFLFSVSGEADSGRLMQKGTKKFMEMVGAKVQHLAMWVNKGLKGESGFDSAKMEKVLQFEECRLYTSSQKMSTTMLASILIGLDVI